MKHKILAVELLESRAAAIEAYTEKNLIDSDGLVYSVIDEKTCKPLKNSDIQGRLNLSLTTKGNVTDADVRAYEDSDMATAEYLLANIYKYYATDEKTAKIIAKRCFKALQAVAEVGKKFDIGFVRPMFGYLPKPYGGLQKAHLSGETSCDQYARTLVAMDLYKDTLANMSEKKWINAFLAASADFWNVNHYTTNYFTKIVRWGICGNHAIAACLMFSGIGARYQKNPHEGWFNVFLSRAYHFDDKLIYDISGNSASLIALSMKWLARNRPEMSKNWIHNAKKACNRAINGVDAEGLAWLFPDLYKLKPGERIEKPYWIPAAQAPGCEHYRLLRWRGNLFCPTTLVAGGAMDVYEMTLQGKYAALAVKLLEIFGENGYVRHTQTLSSKDLPAEYKFMGHLACGLNTAVWLRSYWQLRSLLK